MILPATFCSISLSVQEPRSIPFSVQEPELRLGDWEEKEEEDDHGDNECEDKGCARWNAGVALHHFCYSNLRLLCNETFYCLSQQTHKHAQTQKCKMNTETNTSSRWILALQ